MKNAKLIVPGFLASGIHAGIKEGRRKDLALVYSQVPASTAGVFTTNAFKAAPVLLSQERIRKGVAQAVVINSGNANAATGEKGFRDAVAVSGVVAAKLNIREDHVLVASTGKIGERLPVRRIIKEVGPLVRALTGDGFPDAAKAIMTTDRFPKMEIRRAVLDSREVTVCGIAKGAGMIEPRMATMLSLIITDAAIDARNLDALFRQSVDRTFNAITVDGCMSTNDTALILANGFAGNRPLRKPSADYAVFKEMLHDVMSGLAKAMVLDGEGATKLIEVMVEGARTAADAEKIAYAVARSNLVKTAFFGEDPNWGRIISAAGSAGVSISGDNAELYIEDIPVFKKGMGLARYSAGLREAMKKKNIRVLVRLGAGKRSFSVFTCDLSYEYIRINAEYHT
ncbi:MAG: bifunctional glutamate N-acetyltransferase/amino-acid acetyltransferase ArgJ [Syntrophales bacterium]